MAYDMAMDRTSGTLYVPFSHACWRRGPNGWNSRSNNGGQPSGIELIAYDAFSFRELRRASLHAVGEDNVAARGIALSPDRTKLAVIENQFSSGGGGVHIVDAATFSVLSFVDIGQTVGGFNGLRGVAFRTNEELFVTAHRSGAMYRIDLTAGPGIEFLGDFGGNHSDIQVDKNGGVWAGQHNAGRVLFVPPSSTGFEEIGGYENGPDSNVFSPDGNRAYLRDQYGGGPMFIRNVDDPYSNIDVVGLDVNDRGGHGTMAITPF
jgi:hypothetical protein